MLRVGIIGGGFTGAVVAVQVARRVAGPIAIEIVEPRAMLGGGVAYSAADPAHRINVPASRMVVFGDDPGQFERWLAGEGALEGDAQAVWAPGVAFPQRRVFGRYVASLVEEASRRRGVTIRHHLTRASDVVARPRGFTLRMETGAPVDVDMLVLAVSHPPPAVPARLLPLVEAGAPLIADPWAPGALDGVRAEAEVLIVGTGLTMADVVATLDRRGHRGRITAISRRGQLSRGHVFGVAETWTWSETVAQPRTALGLVRGIRGQVVAAAALGLPWQVVFDDVRLHARRLWSALSEAEQRRIVRHIRPFWDVHRFRVAPQIEAAIARMRSAGQFDSLAASLEGAIYDGARIEVSMRRRHAAVAERRSFDAAVITTGPAHGGAIASNPALAALVRQGLLRADRVGLGLEVDAQSCAVGSDGVARADLLIAGPLARGRFGELMGLPQVSEHADAVAQSVVTLLAEMTDNATVVVANAAA